MEFLDFLFGGKQRKLKTYLEKGSVILDVRTQAEWNNGHIENAIHIPLVDLPNRTDEIKNLHKTVITCCQSGIRSAKAVKILNAKGMDAINGGGWAALNRIIRS